MFFKNFKNVKVKKFISRINLSEKLAGIKRAGGSSGGRGLRGGERAGWGWRSSSEAADAGGVRRCVSGAREASAVLRARVAGQ